jgi:CheY-like chemotaxis protein
VIVAPECSAIINRRILQIQADRWAMIPTLFERPADALSWLREGPRVDVAVLDLQIPDMDGYTLAREIRALDGYKSLPLILLSSSLPSKAMGTIAPDEFAVRLMKPIKQADLFNAIATALGHVKTTTKSLRPSQTFDPRLATRIPLRILVVEDNVVNQKVALRILHQFGYEADLAADGKEALDILEQQKYDLVFMDMQMPVMDGLEATQRICARYQAPDRPYIVAMTANAMKEDQEKCLVAGMDDYLSKPIRTEEIKAAIERSSNRS